MGCFFRFSITATLVATACWGKAQPSRPAWAQVSATVRVFNEAGVDDAVLAKALQRAARPFERAQVNVQWMQGDAAEFNVRITSGRDLRGVSQSALGFATPFATVRTATVLYGRVLEAAALAEVPEADLLGAVMAHELGHLLLESTAHAVRGIMEANWGAEEMAEAARGTLVFTGQEAGRVRARLAALYASDICKRENLLQRNTGRRCGALGGVLQDGVRMEQAGAR